MRSSRLRGGVVLAAATAAIATSAPRSARADFASDALSIVEQLVEDDIITQVVPNLAGSFPATCDMFPASIYALRAKRYGGFPAIVRQEVADNLGFVALVMLEDRNLGAITPSLPLLRTQTVDTLKEIIPGGVTPPAMTNTAKACSFDASVGVQKGSTTITFRTQQTLAKGAQLVFDAQPGSTYTLDEEMERELVGTLTTAYTGNTATALADSKPPGQLWAPQTSIASTMMQECASTQPTSQAEIACGVGLAVRDLTMGSPMDAQTDLRRVLMAIAGDAILATAPAGTKFGDVLAQLRQQASAPATPLPSVLAGVQAAVQHVLGLSSSQVATFDQFAAAIVNVEQTQLGGMGGSPTIAVSLSSGAKAALAQVALLASGAVRIVADLQSKDYGAAANDAFAAVDTAAKRQCPQTGELPAFCTKTAGLVREFLRATSVYAIDSAVNGTVDTTVSSGFRNAAVQLIEDQGGAGVQRNTFRPPASWYVPSFAVRESLRPGFASASSIGSLSSALVTYASVDYPNLRFRLTHATSHVWLGGNVSALDGIGPFVELAERNQTLAGNGTSDVRTQAFWLGFVVPRVEFEIAVPELTRNLVVGLGAGLRFYRSDQYLSGLAPVQASYCIVGNSDSCAGRQSFNGNNMEGSIFVKYVP